MSLWIRKYSFVAVSSVERNAKVLRQLLVSGEIYERSFGSWSEEDLREIEIIGPLDQFYFISAPF